MAIYDIRITSVERRSTFTATTPNLQVTALEAGLAYTPILAGEVVLRRDRDLSAATQLGEMVVHLRRDRNLSQAVQLKTRRPG